MVRRRAAILGLVTVVALAAASGAVAGTPGHWTRVTSPFKSNIAQVGIARTADGTLHVAWIRPTPTNPGVGQDLIVTPVSAGGSVGAPVLVASNWASLVNPALVATGADSLYLFVGGMRSTSPSETIANLALFTSPNGGSTWALYPFDLTKTDAAYASNTAAAFGADGVTPFIAWGSSDCLCVHRGLAPTANVDFQQGLGDFGYEPGIALDPVSHQLDVAWYSNGTGHSGVYAAPVDQATGNRAAAPMQMPGTSTLADGPFSGRTPVVGRPGSGVYVAYEAGYPSHTKVLLWRVGSSSSTLIAKASSDVHGVGVAATPTGRLWVFWSSLSSSDKPVIYAKRSNPTATAWGATVKVAAPKGASTTWNLVGNGQNQQLDLLGSFTIGTSTSDATWHTQVLPGLALGSSTSRLHVGGRHPHKVTFTVTDAGAAVAGAKVTAGSVHGTTNSSGKVTLVLGPFKHKAHVKVRASRSGYVGATLTLRVK